MIFFTPKGPASQANYAGPFGAEEGIGIPRAPALG